MQILCPQGCVCKSPHLKVKLQVVTSFQSAMRERGGEGKSKFTVEKPNKYYPNQVIDPQVKINSDKSH